MASGYDRLAEHSVELAMMAEVHIVPQTQVAPIPDGLLDTDKRGNACLSDEVQLIWNCAQHELLSEELLPFPRLQYAEQFRRDFRDSSNDARVQLQEKPAKAAGLLEDRNGNTAALKQDSDLKYDIYTDKKTPDGQLIGHLAVGSVIRPNMAFCACAATVDIPFTTIPEAAYDRN